MPNQENAYGKDPNILSPELRQVLLHFACACDHAVRQALEKSGILKDGQWLTQEEMEIEYKKSNPEWTPAAWVRTSLPFDLTSSLHVAHDLLCSPWEGLTSVT